MTVFAPQLEGCLAALPRSDGSGTCSPRCWRPGHHCRTTGTTRAAACRDEAGRL